MAIAHDADSASGFKSAASFSWNHTVGSGLSNSILVVGLGLDAPTSITSVKYGGVSMTQAVLQNINEWSAIYYLVNPAAGLASIAVVMVGAVDAICGASSFSGVDQVTPIDANNKADSTTANPSTSVTVVTNNAFIMDCVFQHASANTCTTTNNQIWSTNNAGGPATGAGSWKGPVGTGSQSLAWTSASADWARTIVALRPAAGSVAVVQDAARLFLGVGM